MKNKIFIFMIIILSCGCNALSEKELKMSEKPRIYQIEGIDFNKPSPCEYPVYINSYNKDDFEKNRCSCGNFKVNIHSILIHGYDEYKYLDLSVKGFWGYEANPLFTTREDALKIAAEVKGVKAIPVGYSDWDQQAIPEKDYFEREPKMGALIVVASITNAFDKNGSPLEKCLECATMRGMNNSDFKIDEIRFDFNTWDGSDIFSVEFGYKTENIITQNGIDKLKKLGYDNLVYKEIFWHEGKIDRHT